MKRSPSHLALTGRMVEFGDPELWLPMKVSVCCEESEARETATFPSWGWMVPTLAASTVLSSGIRS